MGPKTLRSTVLTQEEEALIVLSRKHTLLALDDRLYALQPTIPHLTRSSLHRCLQRRGISRLPETKGQPPAKKRFKPCPIGYFHIDIKEHLHNLLIAYNLAKRLKTLKGLTPYELSVIAGKKNPIILPSIHSVTLWD